MVSTENRALGAENGGIGVAERPRAAGPMDLRRQRQRALVECILARAAELMPDDRAVLTEVLGTQRSVAAVARRQNRCAMTLRRRVKLLIRHVLSPRFVFVLQERPNWPARRRAVATLCVLQMRSMREATRRLGLTHYQVRHEFWAIDALVKGAHP